jgi:hypothetical protein
VAAQFLFTPHLVAPARSNGIGSTTSRDSFAPTRLRYFPFGGALVFFSAVVRPRPILSDLHLWNLLHSPIDVAELSHPTRMKIHHGVAERIRIQRLNDDDAACSQEA